MKWIAVFIAVIVVFVVFWELFGGGGSTGPGGGPTPSVRNGAGRNMDVGNPGEGIGMGNPSGSPRHKLLSRSESDARSLLEQGTVEYVQEMLGAQVESLAKGLVSETGAAVSVDKDGSIRHLEAALENTRRMLSYLIAERMVEMFDRGEFVVVKELEPVASAPGTKVVYFGPLSDGGKRVRLAFMVEVTSELGKTQEALSVVKDTLKLEICKEFNALPEEVRKAKFEQDRAARDELQKRSGVSVKRRECLKRMLLDARVRHDWSKFILVP